MENERRVKFENGEIGVGDLSIGECENWRMGEYVCHNSLNLQLPFPPVLPISDISYRESVHLAIGFLTPCVVILENGKMELEIGGTGEWAYRGNWGNLGIGELDN